MLIKFSKMHGLGNDFMVIDAIRQKVFLNPETIRRLANRHTGVGFDQLLLVEPPFSPDHDFHYKIYNADGSEARMCGNGARCFYKFTRYKGLTDKTTIKVSTISGSISMSLLEDDNIKVHMGKAIFSLDKIPFIADKVEKSYSINVLGNEYQISALSMGNPHAILKVDNLEQMDINPLGRAIESHERFPQKVNVGFCQILDEHNIRLRVYERGCGETMACGSNACACAVANIINNNVASPVNIHLNGGDLLIEYDSNTHDVYMTGQASFVFDGIIYI